MPLALLKWQDLFIVFLTDVTKENMVYHMLACWDGLGALERN